MWHLAGLLCAALFVGPAAPLPTDLQESLDILAAASLRTPLEAELQRWGEQQGVPLRLSFDATSRIATQVAEGHPADLVITADRAWMDWLIERGTVEPGSARQLASGRLVVVVARDFPGPVPASLEALATSPGRLGLAGENVPAGRYADQALGAASLTSVLADKVVRGGSVRSVVEWVARGELESGIVYRSDAAADPRIQVAFDVDPWLSGPVEYWIASRSPRASALVAHLTGSEVQALMRASGFETVPQTGTASLPAPLPAATLPSIRAAVALSLLVALVATLLATVPAVGLGWLLARREFAGKALVSTLVLAPLVIPPVVTGFLLLWLFGVNGPLGRALAAIGLQVPFTWFGAVVAAFVVGFPLFVMAARGAFEGVDPEYEDLAQSLGSTRLKSFFRVALPLALPGVGAGMVLAFARALGEFGATIVLAGNAEGTTRTLALAVYTMLETPNGQRGIWMLVAASVVLSFLALGGYELLNRRQKARREARSV